MKIALLSICMMVSLCVGAQDEPQRSYFDQDGNPAAKEEAFFYRIVKPLDDGFQIEDRYTDNDQLKTIATLLQLHPRIYHGPYKTFHKNGQQKESGQYERGVAAGFWTEYYDTGTMRSKLKYDKDRTQYFGAWDNDGNALLHNGTGIIETITGHGSSFTVVDDSLLTAHYNVESADTIFTVVKDMATPRGGLTEFYKGIGQVVKYPKTARKMGIEGKVFVEFVVDKNGKLTRTQILRGIGGGCDEEALRVLTFQPAWTPAMFRGKPVAQKMVLPVVFRLN
jgi:TonB family protein